MIMSSYLAPNPGIVAQSMLARQLAFLQSNQSDSTNSGQFLLSSDFMVRNNNQGVTLGRGGYLPNMAATSEAQFILLRGMTRAYIATGNSVYLTLAQKIFSAAVNTLFGGLPPT